MNTQSNQAAFPYPIGTAMEGGTFGGIIKVNGDIKGVIWAPKSAGQIVASLFDDSEPVVGADSFFDSEANTKALLAAGSPAAQQVTALEINGFKDWLIPARDVLELGYRHFKPTTDKNYCSWRDGENPNSLPLGDLYTPSSPCQTAIEAFQQGADEAFDDYWHWSSTLLPNGRTAFIQTFDHGYQYIHPPQRGACPGRQADSDWYFNPLILSTGSKHDHSY